MPFFFLFSLFLPSFSCFFLCLCATCRPTATHSMLRKPLLLCGADLRNTGLRLRSTRKLPAAPRTSSTRNYKATSWHGVICPHSGDSHPKQDGGSINSSCSHVPQAFITAKRGHVGFPHNYTLFLSLRHHRTAICQVKMKHWILSSKQKTFMRWPSCFRSHPNRS